MTPLATLILALISEAPQAYTTIAALYAAVKGLLPSSDQAAIDAGLKTIEPKLDADLAKLHDDAAAKAVI